MPDRRELEQAGNVRAALDDLTALGSKVPALRPERDPESQHRPTAARSRAGPAGIPDEQRIQRCLLEAHVINQVVFLSAA
jgi:hypothetical protein